MDRAKMQRDAEIQAEAAAWFARIRSDKSDADIAGFQMWLREDFRHEQAFTVLTSVWEAAGGLKHADFAVDGRENRSWPGKVARRSMLAGALATTLIGDWRLQGETPVEKMYATDVGEQDRVPLADGSTIVMDTNTAIQVAFSRKTRTVRLLRGRASFDVAHDPTQPFVVHAGMHQIVALGTSFDVENANGAMNVVLVRGRIAIQFGDSSGTDAVELESPGEEISVSGNGIMHRNQVDLDVATAWQEGKAEFDDQPLNVAVAEMNRYTRRPIVLAQESLGRLRVSGSYRFGNVEAFATSLAALLPISITFEPDRVILNSDPKNQKPSRLRKKAP